MAIVRIQMPGGADEHVNSAAVLTIRKARAFEKKDNPEVQTTIWTGNTRLYPAEDLDVLRQKFDKADTKLAGLKAPDGSSLLVAMPRVVDCDAASPADHNKARWRLLFSHGPTAPWVAVSSTLPEMKELWLAAGLPIDIFPKDES